VNVVHKSTYRADWVKKTRISELKTPLFLHASGFSRSVLVPPRMTGKRRNQYLRCRRFDPDRFTTSPEPIGGSGAGKCLA
jgi:hypothetical protein